MNTEQWSPFKITLSEQWSTSDITFNYNTCNITLTICCNVDINQRLNAAELLRLYLDYDLLEDAGGLVLELMQATLGKGKEMFGLQVSWYQG